MKNIASIFSLFLIFSVASSGLLAAKKKDERLLQQKNSNAYLKHVFPPALSFGIDPLPADRMMLVTKAPKLSAAPIPGPKTPLDEANATVVETPPFTPVETIDPPSLLAEPALPVPPAKPLLPNSGIRLNPNASAVVTSEEILRLLELGSDPKSKTQPSIIVPFEMPFSHTPSAAVLSSKARYIKRIK